MSESNRSSRHRVVRGDAATRLASHLRRTPPLLDDVSRARMERALVEAWRQRPAAEVDATAAASPRRRARFGTYAAVAVAAAAGALLGLVLFEGHPGGEVQTAAAQFELLVDGQTVHSGRLAQGQMLEAGKQGHIEVSLGASRVDIARGGRVRFDRLTDDEVRLSLVAGSVGVAFHPDRPGEQQLSVDTRSAQVQVVGTRFSVHVDDRGDTRVSVSEGVVRVVPRNDGGPRRVAAGEQTVVRSDPVNADEQAVREAIEASLAHVALESDEAAADTPAQPDWESPGAADGELDMDLSGLLEAPRRPSPRPTHARRLGTARRMLRQGKHAEARDVLRSIAESSATVRQRVEALMLIAESYTAQGYIPRAADTYRRAAHMAPGHPAGHNAMFALARLLERYTVDQQAAVVAYQSYLRQAPQGALAAQANTALCRLRQIEYCEP